MRKWSSLLLVMSLITTSAFANVEVGKPAPEWTLKNQDGKEISLQQRKEKGWTVIFFYPKADTPGCTKQACAFRDSIKKIEDKGAKIYGISADTVAAQSAFHKKYKLNFDLLADPDTKVIEAYGVKMPVVGVAKRWTFIVDDKLIVRAVAKDVDPAFDAEWTAKTITELQQQVSATSGTVQKK